MRKSIQFVVVFILRHLQSFLLSVVVAITVAAVVSTVSVTVSISISTVVAVVRVGRSISRPLAVVVTGRRLGGRDGFSRPLAIDNSMRDIGVASVAVVGAEAVDTVVRISLGGRSSISRPPC